MRKALVVFGSRADEKTYHPIVETLKLLDWDTELQILSAHRQLDTLRERLLRDDFDCIIAGAGLAAHLPGVCSAITHRPVYGVPVSNQWGGLDSLYSILQMPKGIPVLTTSLLSPEKNFSTLSEWFYSYDGISLVTKRESLKIAEDCIKKMRSFPFPILINEAGKKFFKIELVDLDDNSSPLLERSLKVPIWAKPEKIDWDKAKSLYLKVSQDGFWVGVNNIENALLAFLRHQNQGKEFTSYLESWKKDKKSPLKMEVRL